MLRLMSHGPQVFQPGWWGQARLPTCWDCGQWYLGSFLQVLISSPLDPCGNLRISRLPHDQSALGLLSALVSLHPQFYFLNSGRPPGPAWVPLCIVVWKLCQQEEGTIVRLCLLVFHSSGATELCCIISSVLRTAASHTVSTVSGARASPAPATASWSEFQLQMIKQALKMMVVNVLNATELCM